MPSSRLYPIALALTFALTGTACGEQARDAANTAAEEARKGIAEATAEGGTVDKALTEAREKLHTENLPLKHDADGPEAAITPDGEFLVDGKALPLNAEQREAALGFRKEVLRIADAGMAIGRQGAALGGEAAALALQSIFGGGDSEAAKARIEAEAKKIEAAAKTLCENVDGLEAAKTRFADLVPEFAPYSKSVNIKGDCTVTDDTADAETEGGEAAPIDTVST